MPVRKIAKKHRELLKKDLLKIKEDTVHDIKMMSFNNSVENKDSRDDGSGHSMHMADVATDMYDKEFNLGLASNDRQLLHKVEDALKRMEDGSYGKCGECGDSINLPRLKAIPYVETCLKCQEEIEKNM